MAGRTGCRALVTMVAALLGAILLSGSDQPVTAHSSYPHWQVLPAPPLAPRTHALGVPAGHRCSCSVVSGPDARARTTARRTTSRPASGTAYACPSRSPTVTEPSRPRVSSSCGITVRRGRRPGGGTT